MAKKKKQICPVPGCGKEKSNIEEHIRICHPEYQPEEAHVETPPAVPSEAPAEPPAALGVAVENTPVVQDAPEEAVTPPPEIEKNSRNYVKIIFAVPLILVGVFLLWKFNTNPITIFLGAASLAGAFFLSKSGWQQGSVRIIHGAADGQKDNSGNPPNTLVFHCKKGLFHATNWFAYEFIEKPMGQRKKRRNDNQWFYVMMEKLETDRTLIEHTLPDNAESEVYCAPEVVANALSLTATKRMFDFNPDNIRAISLLIMLGIIVAEIIGLIALVGDKNAEEVLNILNGVLFYG